MGISEEIKLHLKFAEEELASANALFELGYYRDAISRAYYSMFHAAKALLLTKGINPKKHSGVVKMFGLHFVTEGFIEEIYVKALSRAFALRSRADYDIYYSPASEEAREIVESAEAFLERIKNALEMIVDEEKSP